MGSETDTVEADNADTATARRLPTQPCSVVWSRGHAYVLERRAGGAARWVGVNDRGRPEALTCTEIQRRGWTLAG
jgi:hypothetical protein